jgi:large subunit ribosomal protein L7Ae
MAKDAKKGAAAANRPKSFKSEHPHLFVADKNDYRIGRDVQPKRDLSRFVKMPFYVRHQRQRSILKKRLKVPPAINQFAKALNANQATKLFELVSKYRPETKKEKSDRLKAAAAAEVKDKAAPAANKPKVIKYGLNHIATLVEEKKASLVVIAHDVDPIDLVVWLPALCRRMKVPYAIVKGKARLGQLVHKKTATAIAFTEVNPEDNQKLKQLVSNVNPMFLNSSESKWGGGVMGFKAQAKAHKALKARLANEIKG